MGKGAFVCCRSWFGSGHRDREIGTALGAVPGNAATLLFGLHKRTAGGAEKAHLEGSEPESAFEIKGF